MFSCLGRQHSLGLIAVSFTLTIFLVGVLNRNLLVHKILAVHVLDGFVGGLEIGERDETVPLGKVGIVAGDLSLVNKCTVGTEESTYLRGSTEATKSPKCIVQDLLGDHGIQVAHEQFSSHLHTLLLVG